jgi:hypothetical protein
MTFRIKASESGFDELSELASQIAMLKNPQCWFNHNDMPDAERNAMVGVLEAEMQKLMQEIEG